MLISFAKEKEKMTASHSASQPSIWRQIFTKNMLLCLYTGFCSGLPLF
ncbi:AmpG family muropeptide MFS transporter, partial [Xanthomonas citri pv. citri]|nr:AmpG family muropeptide MFS transporter [Xanthomonas citri pv. citri]